MLTRFFTELIFITMIDLSNSEQETLGEYLINNENSYDRPSFASCLHFSLYHPVFKCLFKNCDPYQIDYNIEDRYRYLQYYEDCGGWSGSKDYKNYSAGAIALIWIFIILFIMIILGSLACFIGLMFY